MSKSINIAGLDKAAILAALYNVAISPQPKTALMTLEQARAHLKHHGPKIEYIQGRALMVDLSGDSLDPWLYDKHNGFCGGKSALAARWTIHSLRLFGYGDG